MEGWSHFLEHPHREMIIHARHGGGSFDINGINKQHAVVAGENNEGGVVWLSFPYAGVKMEASLKMSERSVVSEKTQPRVNQTGKTTVKGLKWFMGRFPGVFSFQPELVKTNQSANI